MIRRFWALMICAVLLSGTFSSAIAAKKKDAVPLVPLTQSACTDTQQGVTITGDRARVDHAQVKLLNQDSVGWIYQESTVLSQPILQGADNELYQKRSFDMSIQSNMGSVYLEAAASPAMDEALVCLYGSGREGGCLQTFNEYKNQAFYDANSSFRLLTPAGDWQADVFASIKTAQRSEKNWLPGQEGQTFDEWLSSALQASEISAPENRMPEADDRILAITLRNSGTNRRVILAVLRPISYETQADVNLLKAGMDRIEALSGMRQVGSLGEMMVYAQNDPVWGEMRYESALTDRYRHFDGGGCGPTAAAIVVANLVEKQNLPELRGYAKNGVGTLMCPCSVNRVYCNHTHVPYLLETAEEYFRYLPVAMGDFAAGNNQWGINSRPTNSVGTNMRFFDQVCGIFGLKVTPGPGLAESLDMLKDKARKGLVLCYALRGSPFTNSSHYVVIAGVDDEYFYVLDPLSRTEKEYEKTDKRSVLEVLAPGVVRIRLEDARKTDMTPVSYIEKAD